MPRTSMMSIVLCLTVFLHLKCKEDLPPDVPPEPSHPTIVWVADTIRNPYETSQLSLRSIWGSDTNDVYVAGHNSAGGNASLFRYDGKTWNVIRITNGEGGFIGSYISLSKIDGSSKSDIWAVGRRGSYYGWSPDSSLVIHFDGVLWKEVVMNRAKHSMQGIKVLSSSNVYLSGSNGEIYHYDGTMFSTVVLDTNFAPWIGGDADRMFAGGAGRYPREDLSVYSKQSSEPWQLIQKMSLMEYFNKQRIGYRDFYSLGGGRYFVAGEGIFIITDTTWQMSYGGDNSSYQLIRGTTPTNVFAVSASHLIHWNGVDWKKVNLPEGIENTQSLTALWVKHNMVFVSYLYSFDTNIIYRGTY